MANQGVQVAVTVTVHNLPLSCPLPNMTLWNMHPKVYLAPDENNSAICPYCSTYYIADIPEENRE